MPRDGSNVYHQPFPDVVTNSTISSTVYNGFTHDVETDLNAPRPVLAGGTGANNATDARFNLAAEVATQIVTNYDTQAWVPGSFRSAVGATGAPNATAIFSGVCYIHEALANPPTNQNVTVEARDVSDGMVYTRVKTAGTWSAWKNDRVTAYAAPFDAMAYNGMQINGNFIVDQPNNGAAYTFASGSVFSYVMDGWIVNKSGTNAFTVQAVGSIFPGCGNALKLTVTTAQTSVGSDQIQLQHRIEGYRFLRCGWGSSGAQPVTVGFFVASSVAGTMLVQLSDGTNNTNAPITITAANTVQWVTTTFPAQAVWSGSYTNGVGINLILYPMTGSGNINIAATNGNTFQISCIVVLPGIEAPSATRSPLIMRPFDQELLTCRRYFQKFPSFAAGGSSYTAGTVWVWPLSLTPTMRTAPFTSATNVAYSNANTFGVNQATTELVRLALNGTATGNFNVTADLTMDARL